MATSSAEFKGKVAGFVNSFDASGVLQNDAQDQASANLCLLVPEQLVSLLIGNGGANVSETKSATGCSISFTKNDDSVNRMRKCFHTGTVASVSRAVYVAACVIGESEVTGTGIGLVVKSEAAGAVIGSSGANLKSIRETTGCNSNFHKDANPLMGGRVLTFRHPEATTLNMTQAVYLTLRASGFASPTQNEVRQFAKAPAAPQDPYAAFAAYGAAPAAAPARYSPYGAPPARAAPGAVHTCAYHGKKRGAGNLQPHPNNPSLMVCQDNDQCKGGDPSSVCSTHGKKRGKQNLQPSPTAAGLFVCFDHDQCKSGK